LRFISLSMSNEAGQHFDDSALAHRRSWSDDDWQPMNKCVGKRAILDFLATQATVCSRMHIYRNLRLREDMPISPDSTSNYLAELVEEGLVRRVSRPPLEQRRLVTASEDERALYIISADGLTQAG